MTPEEVSGGGDRAIDGGCIPAALAGLYAEEYDVPQRQLRGNLPQAFVHALMLECSARLAGHPGAG